MREWSESFHETKEYQRVFYLMDATMKYIHGNNYQIKGFDQDAIILGSKGESLNDMYILYKQIAPFSHDAVKEMHQNIYNLAFLEIGLYTSTLPYLKPEFLKENFEQFKYFLPEEDINYYQRVVKYNSYFYYSDYVNAKNEQEVKQIGYSLNNEEKKQNSSSGGRGKANVKKTPYGALYSDFDQESKTAAFIHHFILPFIIIALSLLIPLIAFLLGR